MTAKKISLFLAILININIVVGGAFFISSSDIARRSGVLAPLSWLAVGLILLPIILVFAALSKKFPVAGGLYVYSEKALSRFWGFLSCWGYFIGTIAGNALLIHEFGKLLFKLGFGNPQFGLSQLLVDSILISFFAFLNLFNIKFLGKIQLFFTILKTIPFLFVIVGMFFLFNPTNLVFAPHNGLTSFFENIPIVLFAYIGFEACCAIGHAIKDGKKNAPRAILISFAITMALYTGIQFCLIGIHGPQIGNPFTAIVSKLTINPALINVGTTIIQLAILSSFLGGYYSMFYANNWNLHTMAKKNTIHFSQTLKGLNRYGCPWVALVIQALLTVAFLILATDVENLTTMSDFGIVIGYLLTSIAFIVLFKNRVIGLLALGGASYLLYICSKTLFENGFHFLLPFLLILSIGIGSYMLKTYKKSYPL